MVDDPKTRRPSAERGSSAAERDAQNGPEPGPERVRTPADLEFTELVAGETTILAELTDSFRWRVGTPARTDAQLDPGSSESANLETDDLARDG